MSEDFSLLGHLGVNVPTVTSQPAQPRTQQRVTTSRILVPKEKPPVPAHHQLHGGSARRSARRPPTSANIITGESKPMFVPTGEVRTEKEKTGGLETEFHIYNSNLPSNMAYNAQMIEKHRKDKAAAEVAKQHFDPALNSMAFEDHATHKTAEERLKERAAQQHDLDARKQLKDETRADRLAKERKLAEEMQAAEAATKADEIERKKQMMREAAAQQKEILQKARENKLRKRQSDVGTVEENQGLQIGDSVDDQSANRERRDKLQECWRQQMSDRENRSKSEKLKDTKLFLENQETARKEDANEKKNRADAVAIMTAQQKAFEQRKEEEAINKHNRMAHERRNIIEEEQQRAKEKQEEQKAKRDERVAFQAAIQHQLSEKELQKKAQKALERAVEQGNDRYSRRTQHDVLMRCPVTNQLLPPSHYNIPLNQRPTPMLTKSEGKVTDLRSQVL